MDKEKRTGILAKLALFGAALIWGSSFVVVKNTTDMIPPFYLLAFRFTVGTLALSIIFFKKLRELNSDYLKRGAVIGCFLFCAYGTQTIGITDTTPGKNAFLTAIYCVLVPFIFWAVDKSKPDRYNVAAALLCIVGIGMVSLTEGFSISMGDSLTLLGGVFYALHLVSITKLGRGHDPVLITILQFAVTAILSWICGAIFEPFPTEIAAGSVYGILFLGLFATAAALLLQNVGQKYTHPSAAAIILSLESVFGVLFSIIFYREQVTLKIGIGFLLIFLAVIVSETKLSFLKKGDKIG